MLNINASLTKMGRAYSSIWSEDLTDDFADDAIGPLDPHRHDRARHVARPRPRTAPPCDADAAALGRRLAGELAAGMAILGVFDEGCMGMYNAIIDDEYLNPMGLYKERLSQSALVAEMRLVERRRGTRRLPVAARPRHDVPIREGRRHRADRGPGARPAAAVHRRGADRGPVRLRRDRHPVPAGPQGHGAGVGPGRGPAQRRRPAAGPRRRRRPRCCTKAGRCRTSTRSTRGPRWTRW